VESSRRRRSCSVKKVVSLQRLRYCQKYRDPHLGRDTPSVTTSNLSRKRKKKKLKKKGPDSEVMEWNEKSYVTERTDHTRTQQNDQKADPATPGLGKGGIAYQSLVKERRKKKGGRSSETKFRNMENR